MVPMKIIKNIFFILAIASAILVVVGLFLPAKKYIERSILIKAPAAGVFNNVNNLKRRIQWDPWKELKPGREYTFGDIIAGKGASVAWNPKGESMFAFEGFLTIKESIPFQVIRTEITFRGSGTGKGTWTFTGTQKGLQVVLGFENNAGDSIRGKYINLFFESLLGPRFDRRLEQLKRFSEKER
jgi:hypothetical protein